MRRGAVLVLASVALLAIVAAPGATPPPATVPREVSSSTLICPESLAGADSWRALGMVVDLDTADGRSGSATAHLLDSAEPLIETQEAGSPVAIRGPGLSAPTTVVEAEGGFAPGLLAGVVGEETSGQARGLDSAACPPASAQWWFVGSGSDLSRDATLLVSNPTGQQARFDIDLIGVTGPLEAVGSRGLDLAPANQAQIRLSALAEGQKLLSVQVTATTGRVAAVLRDVAEPHASQPRGVDFLAASVPPRTELVFAGVPPGEGPRELVLVNPGEAPATASLQLLTPTGGEPMPGLPQVVVPAGRVVSVDLSLALAKDGGAVRLVSRAPLTGAVRASTSGAQRDLQWLAAADPTTKENPVAGALIPVGEGLTSTVAVAAGDDAVNGTLTFVTSDPVPQGQASGSDGDVPEGSAMAPGDETTVAVSVPPDSQLVFSVPYKGKPSEGVTGLVSARWRAATGSGVAFLAHTSSGETRLTGYQWWPAISTVHVDDVREDVGTLMGQ